MSTITEARIEEAADAVLEALGVPRNQPNLEKARRAGEAVLRLENGKPHELPPAMGERCGLCGTRYGEVYRAPDDVWRQVTGYQDGEGLLCPGCFEDAVFEATGQAVYWSASVGDWPEALAALPLPTPEAGA